MTKPRFEVSADGLAKMIARRHPKFVPFEVISNAWDTDGGNVAVSWTRVDDLSVLRVEDDDPDGFADLRHAYTLFEQSTRGGDAGRRGRFGIGEKLSIARCEYAQIQTTKGCVTFDADSRTETDAPTERGSVFSGHLRCTDEEHEEILDAIVSMIPPRNMATTVNGTPLLHRDPVASFDQVLLSEIAGDDGALKRTWRKTTVHLYEPLDGEDAAIYELGVPVVTTGDRWHADIQQKVPLNVDRDNVTPAYLRDLRAAILNHAGELLDADDGAENWMLEAASSAKATPEAVAAFIDLKFGPKAVISDMSDPEANKIAMSEGYAIVSSRSLPKAVWQHVKAHGILQPAGQVTPSPRPYDGLSGSTRETMPEGQWSPGMRRIADLTKLLGRTLLDVDVHVEMVNDAKCMSFRATYGTSPIAASLFEYNYRVLGRKWFDQPNDAEPVLWLIAHELAHQFSGDHFSSDYHGGICTIAARLARALKANPSLLD